MRVELPQLQKTIEGAAGEKLLTCLQRHAIPLAHSCAGEGVCGTCYVHLRGDGIPPPSKLEELLARQKTDAPTAESKKRMACLVEIPAEPAAKNWIVTVDYW